jgi:hypothetical protein
MKNKPLMKMSALAAMGLLVVVAFAGLPTTANGEVCEEASHVEVTLMAGQDIPVGTVTVWPDSDENINVDYEIALDYSEWSITEIHFAIAALDDCTDCYNHLPITKSGSPKVGNFYYKDTDGSDGWGFSIPFGDEGIINDDPDEDDEEEIGFQWGECLCFAAHAVVETGEDDTYQTQTGWGEGTEFPKSWAMYVCFKPVRKLPTIPTSIVFTPHHVGNEYGDLTYWDVEITSGGSGNAGNGWYDSWCVDIEGTLNSHGSYAGSLSIPDSAAWRQVNWILNNIDDATYTGWRNGEYRQGWESIQAAIWKLVVPGYSYGTSVNGVILNAEEKIDAAAIVTLASGHEDFYPSWGQVIAVLISFANDDRQEIIIEVDP